MSLYQKLQQVTSKEDVKDAYIKALEDAYKALTEKLQPMLYELGFLRV